MAPKRIKVFDLSLLITELGQAYQISATSACLDSQPTVRLPASALRQLTPLAEKLQQGPLQTQELRDLGARLFEALIRDDVRDMYRLLEGMNVDALPFQLSLNIHPHQLQRLPWECMYDPYRESFLSLQDNIHMIRLVERKQGSASENGSPGYSNLVIAIANPHGQPPIDPQKEHDLIEQAVGDLHQRGKLNRSYVQGSQEKVRAALSQTPSMFHFVGHGGINRNDIPGLYLEDSFGDAVFIPASELENEYFTPPPESDRRIKLVILSACQTSETPKTDGYNSLAYQLISQVDTILAMQYPIGLENLTEFNTQLYHGLADDLSLETAVNAARRRLVSDKPGGARDWISPVVVKHQAASSKPLHLFSQNPFKGPVNYDLPDRRYFFGREKELKKLSELYQKLKVVVVRGDTGCGKTSLLKAGWVPSLIAEQTTPLYLNVSEGLQTELRLEINKLLTQAELEPLPPGELDQLLHLFPQDAVIILDRVEQIDLLGEQIGQLVAALVGWAVDPQHSRPRARLVIATRLNEAGREPELLQQLLPEYEYPRMNVEMLEYGQAAQVIDATMRKSDLTFLPETVHAILSGLKYDQPKERNLTALQVVCRAVYQHAAELTRTEVTPEILKDLDGVDGILDREFKIASKLAQTFYAGGDSARKVLAQFVGSDQQSMRPRTWDDLLLRCDLEKGQLSRLLDRLEIDGLIRREQQPGEEKYELVHETLTQQMDWLSEEDVRLRQLEEIVESAHAIIPLMSAKGGLKDLDARRDELTLSSDQQELLLQSALEAGHEVDYWWRRIQNPKSALSVLTSQYLSVNAQEHACRLLGMMGKLQDEFGQAVKERLLALAIGSQSPPRIIRAASLALAPLVDEAFLKEKFAAQPQDLDPSQVAALALMFDSHPLPLKGISSPARRQIRMKMLKDNSFEIMASVLRAAMLGAAGFGLAAAWLYSQVYFGSPTTTLPPFTLLVLGLSLVGLLTFMLALPGALCAPLGRDIATIISGGRRSLPAALGTLAGSAFGIGLTVALLAALAEYSQPSLPRLLRYFISGAGLGIAIALPWLLAIRWPVKRIWLVLLAGVSGALAFSGISALENWWPATSFALSVAGPHLIATAPVAGSLIGLGNALGLTWGRLRNRPL